jgi:hypothetical protein
MCPRLHLVVQVRFLLEAPGDLSRCWPCESDGYCWNIGVKIQATLALQDCVYWICQPGSRERSVIATSAITLFQTRGYTP